MTFTRKIGILGTIELMSALICIYTGTLICGYLGTSISSLIMCVLMAIIPILLIIFARQHVYWHDKPLLTVLSIYYKSVAYVTIIFVLINLPGKDFIKVSTYIIILLYIVLSYFNGKKYYQMLNAYLYLNLIIMAHLCFAMFISFMENCKDKKSFTLFDIIKRKMLQCFQIQLINPFEQVIYAE